MLHGEKFDADVPAVVKEQQVGQERGARAGEAGILFFHRAIPIALIGIPYSMQLWDAVMLICPVYGGLGLSSIT